MFVVIFLQDLMKIVYIYCLIKVYFCISTVCFNNIYGKEPLEDGEYDSRRIFKFKDCYKNLLNECKKEG